jgi:hypothetical protein
LGNRHARPSDPVAERGAYFEQRDVGSPAGEGEPYLVAHGQGHFAVAVRRQVLLDAAASELR